MIKQKALRKILITSITLFIILSIYLIPNIKYNDVLETNLELKYVSSSGTNYIYLLDKNNYLVKTKISITEKDDKIKVKKIINNLINNSKSSYSDNLKAPLNKNVKLLDVEVDKDVAIINFSKEFFDIDEKQEDRIFESIVYSVTDLDSINGVIIKVENEVLGNYPISKKKLPSVLTKDIGINKEYNITNRKDINKVVIYYLENIDETNYYVPVTKYVNDSRDKIKIIIDNLTTNYIYEPNLMSLLDKNTKLNSYKEQENIMFVDFNNSVFGGSEKIEEEVIYSISYSIFDNYDVDSVIYTVNNSDLKQVKRSDLS